MEQNENEKETDDKGVELVTAYAFRLETIQCKAEYVRQIRHRHADVKTVQKGRAQCSV